MDQFWATIIGATGFAIAGVVSAVGAVVIKILRDQRNDANAFATSILIKYEAFVTLTNNETKKMLEKHLDLATELAELKNERKHLHVTD